MSVDENHQGWSELAAGHALSSLEEADEAAYTRHAETCAACRKLEDDIVATLAEVARAAPSAAPPALLRASIMSAVADDGIAAAPADLGTRRAERRAPKSRLPVWISVAAAVVLIAGGVTGWAVTRSKPASVAERCASAHCPSVALTADGHRVATVIVLDDVAYVQPIDLAATPAGHSYVLWRVSAGRPPVGVAALRTKPGDGPVKAGSLAVPITDVTAFALSEEPGDTVPAAPSHVLAQGDVA